MKNIIRWFHQHTPTKQETITAINSFSKKKLVIFGIFATIAVVSGLMVLNTLNKMISTDVPTTGGSITEGIVGTPRFINPVLALSDTDKDMVALIFSGLMRHDENGELVPDLATSYDVSKDGLTYTFVLKDNVTFHDGTTITADDVIYTINTIKDPLIKSPRKINWDGVTVKKIDNMTVQFTLKQPFSSFLENTTIGILPSHLWIAITAEQFPFSDLNINAIGSGPYKKNKVSTSSGLVTQYSLKSFSKFVFGEPYITNFTLVFYANEQEMVAGLESGDVDQISAITGDKAHEFEGRNESIKTAVLPRIFGLYFNQNENAIFLDKNVVSAIDLAINRDRIIREVLSGYGVAINSPIPPYIVSADPEDPATTYQVDKANSILDKAGYVAGADGTRAKVTKKGKVTTTGAPLSFTIATGDAPELKQTALLIQEDMAVIGIHVDLKISELGILNQEIIRPRKYDALLFGQVVAHESDLYAFWHSSQRHDPGANIALYANSKVDKLLEDALVTTDETTRLAKYAQIKIEIEKDKPAIFIYSPNFIYLTSPDVHNVDISHIITAAQRFENVYHWYIQTDRIWNVFVAKQNNND